MNKISPYVFPILKHYMLPKNMYSKVRFSNLTNEDVVQAICEEFRAPADLFTRKTRKRVYVEPRKVYCKIAVCIMKRSTVSVATEMPGYDHSVVIHACNTFDELFETDEFFRSRVIRIFSKLNIPI
jgi:chromosomal replication initiator protein